MEPNWYVLVRTWGPMVYSAAWRVLGHEADAEDVTQDVFTEALGHWQRNQVRNWGAWLRRLTVCRAIDRLRQRKPMVCMNEIAEPIIVNAPEAGLERRELADQLRQALHYLTEHEAAIFCLRYFEELSYDEIAKALTMDTAAVGMTLHRAKAKLAERLEAVWKEV